MKFKKKCEECKRTKLEAWIFYVFMIATFFVMILILLYVHEFETTCDGCIERGDCVRPMSFTYGSAPVDELAEWCEERGDCVTPLTPEEQEKYVGGNVS